MTQTKMIILAAGKGTRMKSELAKVLHKVQGKEMVNHVLDMADQAGINETYLVIGHQAEQVKAATAGRGVIYALQAEQLGTGHAVMMVEPTLTNYEGVTIITCGDVPLLKANTVKELIAKYESNKLDGVILTVELDDPKSYGRIIRGADGLVTKIVEFKDANEQEKAVKEINSGIYCFNTKLLFDALKNIKSNNAQKEYYLTDVIEILVSAGKRVGTMIAKDPLEAHGVNDLADLAIAETALATA